MILHESFRVPITSNVGESVLCGAQAATMAFGRDNSPSRMSWVEELIDSSPVQQCAGANWVNSGEASNEVILSQAA